MYKRGSRKTKIGSLRGLIKLKAPGKSVNEKKKVKTLMSGIIKGIFFPEDPTILKKIIRTMTIHLKIQVKM